MIDIKTKRAPVDVFDIHRIREGMSCVAETTRGNCSEPEKRPEKASINRAIINIENEIRKALSIDFLNVQF